MARKAKLPLMLRKGAPTNLRPAGAHRNAKNDKTRAEKLRRALEEE